MRKGCRVFLITVFTVLLLLLCGCGSKVNTQMQVDKGFQGARVMNCVISKNDLGRVVGGADSIDSMLSLNCPQALSWERREDGADIVYVFTLSFENEAEYEKKVTSLLSRAPSILYAMPDSVFAKGFRLEEDFTSLELMAWFDKTAVEKGLLKEGESLFSLGDTSLLVGGETVSTQETIQYNNIEYKPIDKISIDTLVTGENTMRRTLRYQIPHSTYNADPNAVQAYMKSLVPEGGNGEWKDIPTGKAFTVSFEAATVEALSEKTRIALDNDTAFSQLDESESTVLSNQLNYTEKLSFASFASGRGGKVFVEYSYQTDFNSGIASARVYNKGRWVNVDEYVEGNSFSIGNDMAELKINLQAQNEYTVKSVGIDMTQTSQGNFTRRINLAFQNTAQNVAPKAAKEYFDKKAVDNAAVTVKGNTCTVEISGGIEEINLALGALFGAENKLALTYENGFQLYHSVKLQDSISLDAFLKDIGYEGQVDYSYTSQNGISESIQRSQIDGQTISGSIDGNKAQGPLTSGAKTVVSITSNELYVPYVLAVIAIVLAVIAALIVLSLLILRLFDPKRRQKHSRRHGRFQQSEESCASCGAELYEGMLYCIHCGAPLYDLEETGLVVFEEEDEEDNIEELLYQQENK